MTIFDMSTSRRHLELVGAFNRTFTSKELRNKGYTIFSESAALVYNGHRRIPHSLALIDINSVHTLDLLDDLYFIEPDFMLFHKNDYLWNKRETKLAGYPDLVVEVWSEGNSAIDREEKFLIYSNSNRKTEHWYIVQNSNQVECFIGDKKLENQSLTSVLRTIGGIEFDLTNLAL